MGSEEFGRNCRNLYRKKNNQDKVEKRSLSFFVRSQIVESINTYSFDGEAILVPGEGNIGKIFHYINGKFDFHQRVYKIAISKTAITENTFTDTFQNILVCMQWKTQLRQL